MTSQDKQQTGTLKKGIFIPAAIFLVIFITLVAIFPDKAYETLTGLSTPWEEALTGSLSC